MTYELFAEWITEWEIKLLAEGRSILLLVDNFSGHKEPSEYQLTSVCLEFFSSNLTSHVQPLDAGIIASWKCRYRSEYISYIINHYENEVPVAKVFKINQIDAMERAENSWYDVTEDTISNCYRKAGIVSPRNLDGSLLDGPNSANANLNTEPLVDDLAHQDLEQDLHELVSL